MLRTLAESEIARAAGAAASPGLE
jgi:hypothetical protein